MVNRPELKTKAQYRKQSRKKQVRIALPAVSYEITNDHGVNQSNSQVYNAISPTDDEQPSDSEDSEAPTYSQSPIGKLITRRLTCSQASSRLQAEKPAAAESQNEGKSFLEPEISGSESDINPRKSRRKVYFIPIIFKTSANGANGDCQLYKKLNIRTSAARSHRTKLSSSPKRIANNQNAIEDSNDMPESQFDQSPETIPETQLEHISPVPLPAMLRRKASPMLFYTMTWKRSGAIIISKKHAAPGRAVPASGR